jgi:hypothetical protein
VGFGVQAEGLILHDPRGVARNAKSRNFCCFSPTASLGKRRAPLEAEPGKIKGFCNC